MAKLFLLIWTAVSSVFTVLPAQAPTVDVTPAVAGVSVESPAAAYEKKLDVALPITVTAFNPWYKAFGTWVDDGRFFGYHAGDDIEMDIADLKARRIADVPVYAMADGTVQYVGWVKGYGGVVILKHTIDGKTISSLYGHVDDTTKLVKKDDVVKKGQQIAVLGEGLTEETDGRRMHLHFALWNGDEVKFPGYVETAEELSGWLDPYIFLHAHGLLTTPQFGAHIRQEGEKNPEQKH